MAAIYSTSSSELSAVNAPPTAIKTIKAIMSRVPNRSNIVGLYLCLKKKITIVNTSDVAKMDETIPPFKSHIPANVNVPPIANWARPWKKNLLKGASIFSLLKRMISSFSVS